VTVPGLKLVSIRVRVPPRGSPPGIRGSPARGRRNAREVGRHVAAAELLLHATNRGMNTPNRVHHVSIRDFNAMNRGGYDTIRSAHTTI
jgi:hypothetical protein